MGNNPSLSGPLPVNVGGLISLVYLDLHDAGLVGYIPPTISNLASLAFLRLDSNELYGTCLGSRCRWRQWICTINELTVA